MLQVFQMIDQKCMYGADYKDKCDVKERRKKYKIIKSKKADAFLHKCVQSQSQSFYSKNEVGKQQGKRKEAQEKVVGQLKKD